RCHYGSARGGDFVVGIHDRLLCPAVRACLSADMTPKGNTNLRRRWLKGLPPSCQRSQRQVSISLGSEAGQGVDHGRGDDGDGRLAAAGGGFGAGDDVHVDRYWSIDDVGRGIAIEVALLDQAIL